MINNTITINAKKYLELFSNKNLDKLEEMYDDNIILKDWNGVWKGKKEVLNMNNNLFQDAKSLQVNIKQIHQTENRTYCHIDIKVNDDKLDVLDVIDWNENYKISKIEAFNG